MSLKNKLVENKLALKESEVKIYEDTVAEQTSKNLACEEDNRQLKQLYLDYESDLKNLKEEKESEIATLQRAFDQKILTDKDLFSAKSRELNKKLSGFVTDFNFWKKNKMATVVCNNGTLCERHYVEQECDFYVCHYPPATEQYPCRFSLDHCHLEHAYSEYYYQ